jgi:hypothetical protein
MGASSDKQRRSYGTGSLRVRTDAHGRETWYGQWHANGRIVKRRLGQKRAEGGRDGLTKSQAETELRRRMEAEREKPSVAARVTVEDASERLITHLEAMGRKRSTLRSYRSHPA